MIQLLPAYGRDYTSASDVVKDFEGGKDFILADITSQYHGSYCSIRDMIPGKKLALRYNKQRDIKVYEVIK